MGSVFDRCKAVLAAVAAASGVLLYSADVVDVKFVQRGSAPIAEEMLMHNIRLRPGTAYTRELLDEVEQCLNEVRRMYNDIGIELNEKKTKIVRLSDEFKFLKVKTRLTNTGRVVMRPDRGTITRERRKLKALRRKLDEGKITFDDVVQAFNSWKGHIKHFDSYRTTRNMDKLFNELFQAEIKQQKKGVSNNGKNKKRFRGEFIRYEFPERIDPAERRHTVRRHSERNNV